MVLQKYYLDVILKLVFIINLLHPLYNKFTVEKGVLNLKNRSFIIISQDTLSVGIHGKFSRISKIKL